MQFPNNLRKLTDLIFNLMGLINNNVVPLYLLQTAQTDTNALVTGH